MKTKIIYSLLIFTVIILSSCTDRKFDNPVSTAESRPDLQANLQQGWEMLENGNLDAALVKFETVLEQAPETVDAQVGASSIYLAKNEFQKAIDSAEVGLENASANYVSVFDSTVNKNSIHLTLAQAYYYIGNFNRSNDQVRQLTGKNVTLSQDSLIQEIERLGEQQ
jgi:tetratricopeptide (TPR) repeat protein